MNINLNKVREHVELYFKENLPKYTVLEIRRKSSHPDDSYLFMVSAKMITALMPFGLAGMNSTRASITVTTI